MFQKKMPDYLLAMAMLDNGSNEEDNLLRWNIVYFMLLFTVFIKATDRSTNIWWIKKIFPYYSSIL